MVWDSDQYWLKAQLYALRAFEDGRRAWERPFWSALALELLARSALTRVHPALNADPQQEDNLFYALGFEIKGQPRSIPVHAVLARLQKLLPTFDKPTREFCDFLILVRNREVHTSELAFEGLAEAEWLPRYYKACQILCQHLGHSLEELVGRERALAGASLVAALESAKRDDVLKAISAHRKVFNAKPEVERTRLRDQQMVLSMTWLEASAAATCPSCGSVAKLIGDLESQSEPMFREDGLIVEQRFLASQMDCGACGLVLKDVEEIHIAGFDPHFTKVVATDLHAYFEPEYYDEYMNM